MRVILEPSTSYIDWRQVSKDYYRNHSTPKGPVFLNPGWAGAQEGCRVRTFPPKEQVVREFNKNSLALGFASEGLTYCHFRAVQCVYCRIKVTDFTEYDRPDHVHRLSPHCPRTLQALTESTDVVRDWKHFLLQKEMSKTHDIIVPHEHRSTITYISQTAMGTQRFLLQATCGLDSKPCLKL